MLTLKNIHKVYRIGEIRVVALKEINLQFRQNEFVSILGHSGSGKTTLLNLIGGLDRYTSGDLIISGRSTASFSDSDWDTYRNSTIGFVFQNYNLIPHLSVLGNVEIALTLSGISIGERKRRAMEVLEQVGLTDQATKRPNQLSGGQQQRVAIARALVNNPKILLADEPTGALDSATSRPIMDLLTVIAKERLVIMVTHNDEISQEYSTRIINLKDGEVTSDTNPYLGDEDVADKSRYSKKSSMSFLTALNLSFHNLKAKFTRTIITAFAGSIGIIGIALVLAISNGMTQYISAMQSDSLSGYPISISSTTQIDTGFDPSNFMNNRNTFPEGDVVYPYDSSTDSSRHTNLMSSTFLSKLNEMDPELTSSISYNYGVSMNLITQTEAGEYKKISSSSIGFQQMTTNDEFVLSQYDVLAGDFPVDNEDILLVVDGNNRVSAGMLAALGIPYLSGVPLHFEDFIGETIKLMFNDDYYRYNEANNTYYSRSDVTSMYNDNTGKRLVISGVIRIKEDASSSMLNRGIAYSSSLTQELLQMNLQSDIVEAQLASPTKSITSGLQFNPGEFEKAIISLGGSLTPTSIQIYPKSFDAKNEIKKYLDEYNEGKETVNQIIYSDLSETIFSTVSKLISTISIILSAFAGISLVVSSIMIGIITYVSVVERTKEIGVLRSLGARKKDISRVFNAETIIIGFVAGIIGVAFSYLLSFPINSIVYRIVSVSGIANLAITSAIILILVSMVLTFIAGLIPSQIAANKDPVVALRTE